MPPSAAKEREAVDAFVREIARRAGQIQLSRLGNPHEVREKAPKDVVTEVDLLCEEYLVSAIRQRYPEDAILSKERGGTLPEEGRTWLLDSLDGTVNYSRGFPLFCCCVSVLEASPTGHHVAHAAVTVLALGGPYHASAGGGAWLDRAGGTSPLRVAGTSPLRVAGTAALKDAFVGANSRFGGAGERRPLDRLYRPYWQVRSIGSAGVRGSWVAAGHLDVSGGETNSAWDYAPTALLVAEAGGTVTDLDGDPWTLASGGMLATNGAVHWEALEVLAGRAGPCDTAAAHGAGSPRAGE